MKITIIGAGNTAVAAACFLKTLGLSSLIYTRREERAKQWNQFPVKASGACTGSFSLESTMDLKPPCIMATFFSSARWQQTTKRSFLKSHPTCRRISPFFFQRLLGRPQSIPRSFKKTGYTPSDHRGNGQYALYRRALAGRI